MVKAKNYKKCPICNDQFIKTQVHCSQCYSKIETGSLEEFKKCNQCHALFTSNADTCIKCSGNFISKPLTCIVNRSMESNQNELEEFLRTSEERFFSPEITGTIEIGNNIFQYLLSKLNSKDYYWEYSAFLGIRMCGMEIWGKVDESGYYYRFPESLKFHEFTKQ